MILTPHITVGILIGSKINDLGLIALLAIILHFILDQIPHWDYLTYEDVVNFRQGKKLKTILKTTIDLLIGLAIFAFCIYNKQLDIKQLIPIVCGIVFSVLPDFIWGLSMIFKSKFLNQYRDFHERIGRKAQKEGKFTFLGIFTQIIVVVISLLLLFSS